jgi:plasmid stabilization system protein ParE
MSAKEAEKRLGEFLTESQKAPVTIGRNGEPVAVVQFTERHEVLEDAKADGLKRAVAEARAGNDALDVPFAAALVAELFVDSIEIEPQRVPTRRRLTPADRLCLRALRDRLGDAAGRVRQRRSIERPQRRCRQRAVMPNAGRRLDDLDAGVRSTVVPPYVILYELRSPGMRMLRIIHGSPDIDPAWRDES